MKSLIIAVVMLAGAATASAQPAASAQDTRWTAPSGQWSVDYVSQGWTYANPLPEQFSHFARIMMPLEPPPEGEVRMCAVTEVMLAQRDDDVGRVRSTAARLTEAEVASMLGGSRQTITAIAVSDVDGVSVADISTRSEGSEMTHLRRVFYLPVDGRVLFVDIDCFWPASLDPTKAAEIPAVLGTLAITSGAAQ